MQNRLKCFRFKWWVRRDSNPGPPACEAEVANALNDLAVRYRPHSSVSDAYDGEL